MIRRLELHNFRGVADGRVSGFTTLVVLVGPNGSAKSTVLDALLVAGVGRNVDTGVQAACGRRPPDGQQHRWLVRGGSGSGAVALVEDGWRRTVTLAVDGQNVTGKLEFAGTPEAGPMSNADVRSLVDKGPPSVVRLVEPVQTGTTGLADLYTHVAEQGRRREVNGMLTELIPDLKGIEILAQNGLATLYLVYSDRIHPAALAGDGIHLLLKLGMELAARSGGTVLLEEPETHMHPAAITLIAKAVWAAVRRQVQVIITTHSLDLIDAIVAGAVDGDLQQLTVCRFRLTDGHLASSCLSGPDVAFSRSDIQDDLR